MEDMLKKKNFRTLTIKQEPRSIVSLNTNSNYLNILKKNPIYHSNKNIKYPGINQKKSTIPKRKTLQNCTVRYKIRV